MTQVAIHTQTNEEFIAVTEALGAKWHNPDTRWAHYGKDTIVLSHTHGFASAAWARKYGFQIVKAPDWIDSIKTEDMTKVKKSPTIQWISSKTNLSYEWATVFVFMGLFIGCIVLAVMLKGC